MKHTPIASRMESGAARLAPTPPIASPQSIRESFAQFAAEERAKRKPVAPRAEPDTLDPYGDTDWPEDWLFRSAPYHGWPI